MEPVDLTLRLPDPTAARTPEDLTAALRALHQACGRPTYESLSARTGLPKSAISYLVGRNPVRQPSATTLVRFVRGCLSYVGLDADATEEAVQRWRLTHDRLVQPPPADATDDTVEPPTVPPAPEAPGSRDPRPTHRRRALVVVAAGVGTAALVAGIAAGVARSGPSAGTPVASPTATGPTTTGPTAASASATAVVPSASGCAERAEPQRDARLGRSWPTVFYCRNRPAQVYAWAQEDDRPVADLESRDSWFVCWTQGRSRSGAREVFYYTQGDTTWRRPELDAWGFVPASAVAAAAPAEGLTRRCTFPSGT